MPLQPGTQLGRYSIVSSLGAGGMGEVYRATDPTLGREVAIKVLPEAVTADAERLARFEREARALAALNHPNIATLFGMERAELDGTEQPFLVMELVEGPTLGDRIGRGAMPWQEAAQTFLEIASALEAAHENGIVHRDLKPANVKIGQADATGEARVKVLDFGLAKAMDTQTASGSMPGLSESPTLTLAATMRGEVLGTAGYMAPEQARGTAVDKRADVWAFGVCLFEALTGQGTFGGDTISDKLASVLKDEPDWDTLPEGTPPRLERLMRRCLQKSARNRLRDIGEARIVLSELLADPDGAVERAAAIADDDHGAIRPTPRRWLLPVAAAAAFTLGILLTGFFGAAGPDSADPTTPSEPVRFSIGAADGGDLGMVGGITLSPDGRWLVYAGITAEGAGLVLVDDSPPLRVRALDSFDSETRILAGTEGAITPFFSADSQWVGYLHGSGGQRTVYRVHVESGSIVQVTNGAHVGYHGDWGDDGRMVIGAARGALAWVDQDSRSLAPPFTELDIENGELAHVNPEILPGGRGVIFTSIRANSDGSTIKVWDAETGTTTTLVEHGGEARYLGTGHLVYANEGQLAVVDFDLDNLAVVGDPRIVGEGLRTLSLNDAAFSVADNGTLVYLPGEVLQPQEMRLLWVTPDSEVQEEVARGDIFYPAISSDGGRWVARTGRNELTLWEADSPLPLSFTTTQPIHYPPFFLEGGREVAFAIQLPQTVETGLYRIDLGTGESTIETYPTGNLRLPIGLDPTSGDAIVQLARPLDNRSFNWDIGFGPLDGSEPDRVLFNTPATEGFAKLSRDGRIIAWEEFDGDGSYGGKIFATDFPAMSRRIAIGNSVGSKGYAWTHDGRLIYTDIANQQFSEATFELEPALRVTGVRKVIGELFHYWAQRSIDVAPDGRLLVVRGFTTTLEAETRLVSERFHVVLGWTQAEGLTAAAAR